MRDLDQRTEGEEVLDNVVTEINGVDLQQPVIPSATLSDLKSQIDSLAKEYTANARTLSSEQKLSILRQIQQSYSKCKEFGDDKVQLAMQTYEMVNGIFHNYIKKSICNQSLLFLLCCSWHLIFNLSGWQTHQASWYRPRPVWGWFKREANREHRLWFHFQQGKEKYMSVVFMFLDKHLCMCMYFIIPAVTWPTYLFDVLFCKPILANYTI